MRVLVPFVVSAAVIGLLTAVISTPMHTLDLRPEDRQELAIVYAGGGGDVVGCGALSAFDTSTGEVVYRGPEYLGHSQVAANSTLTQIIASWSQGDRSTAYLLDASSPITSAWTVRTIKSKKGTDRVATKAGVAIMPDDDRFILGEEVGGNLGIGQYRLSDIGPDEEKHFGPRQGFWRTKPDSSAWIISAPRGRNDFVNTDEEDAIVITEEGEVYILDTEIMATRSASIDIEPRVIDRTDARWSHRGQSIFAALAQGRRYLVTNRWSVPELNSVDLNDHKAYTIGLSADLGKIGGVAFNWGWHNPGMLAVHAGDQIAVYDYQPPNHAVEVGRIEIPAPMDAFGEVEWPGYIAWSTDGTKLIATTEHEGSEFVVLDVDACGRSLSTRVFVTVCKTDAGGGHGIVTLNGHVQPPLGFAQPCPTPYWDPSLDPEFSIPAIKLYMPSVLIPD